MSERLQLVQTEFSLHAFHDGFRGRFLLAAVQGQVKRDLRVQVAGQGMNQSRKAARVVQRVKDVDENATHIMVHCKIGKEQDGQAI